MFNDSQSNYYFTFVNHSLEDVVLQGTIDRKLSIDGWYMIIELCKKNFTFFWSKFISKF